MDAGSAKRLSATIVADRRATPLAWPDLLQTILGISPFVAVEAAALE
jgi:hypothetical protein